MTDDEYAECIVSIMDHTLAVEAISDDARARNERRRENALGWLREFGRGKDGGVAK